MSSILFATTNSGKLADARKMASAYDIAILSPSDLGLNLKIEENGETFAENALIKYRAYRDVVDDPDMYILTDDGGLLIDALGGEPGVRSRRWAGYEMNDAEIINYCLSRLAGVPLPERTARFQIVMAFGRGQEAPILIEETEEGLLLEEPDLSVDITGLPFRALFYLPLHGQLLAHLHALPLQQRRGYLMHRERALIRLFDELF